MIRPCLQNRCQSRSGKISILEPRNNNRLQQNRRIGDSGIPILRFWKIQHEKQSIESISRSGGEYPLPTGGDQRKLGPLPWSGIHARGRLPSPGPEIPWSMMTINPSGGNTMQGLDVNCSAGPFHLYQLLPAPPGWYAVFGDVLEQSAEPIAAFALLHGPTGRGLRLVGVLGGEKELTPVDCFKNYLKTSFWPSSEG